jgi:hypothetical protein
MSRFARVEHDFHSGFGALAARARRKEIDLINQAFGLRVWIWEVSRRAGHIPLDASSTLS